MLLIAGLLFLPSNVHATTGISLPSDSTPPFSLKLEYKQTDSSITFEAGSLLVPVQTAQPANRAAASTPTLDLGTLLSTPRSALAVSPDTVSLDLRTFRAFQNQDQVIKTWNRDILVLMKKSDRDKSGPLRIGVQLPAAVASVVGEGGAGLQVSGRQRISFAGRSQWNDVQVTSSIRPSKFPSLIMQQENSFTVEGTIGSKVSVKVDQDSKRQTDLENRIQIRYKGDEDDILQRVEAGNTNLSLPNTQFVGYSQQIQGLFGLKAAATVGPIDLTMITSQEKGNTVRNRVTAGANQTDVTFRDYLYSANRFFDLGIIADSNYLEKGDVIDTFYLYRSTSDQTAPLGKAWNDVLHKDRYPNDGNIMNWEILGSDKYIVVPGQHYIYFPSSSLAQELKNYALAYYMTVKKANDQRGRIFGNRSGQSYELQYLKPAQLKAGDALWGAMWKNVYDLGIKNIKYEELTTLDIKKGPAGTEQDQDAVNPDHQNGVPYLQLFGLDREGQKDGSPPDGKVDHNSAILNLDDGLLIFPNREPFAPGPNDTIHSVKYPEAVFHDSVPAIYTTSNDAELRTATKYYIKMTTRRRATSFTLGRVNILPESEVVTLGGTRLNRGPDYTIDYDLGTITFLRPEVLDPNSQLTIDYEYAPFMSLDKRSLFGMRGEYKPSPDFHTGATFLYKGSKSTDRPAQLGAEPFRDMVLDYDIYWKANSPFLTKLVDALPLVKTTAASSITLGAEIARSMPNPNTKGSVLIDDFESAKRAYSFSLGRGHWTIASPPLDSLNTTRPTRGLYDPAFMWFIPYVPFPETAIYNRDIAKGSASNAQVLVLDYRPNRSLLVKKDSLPTQAAWGGMMCPLPQGVWDQSRAEYIELRMAKVGSGKLHIDLGRISEDVNGNDSLNTEDGYLYPHSRNSILDPGEDVGLDTIPDEHEVSWDGKTYDAVTNHDPAGDDWQPPQRDATGVYHYDKINGTEKNAEDPDRLGIPDTEDIGGRAITDFENSYYSYTIDLDNPDSIKVVASERPSGDWTRYAPSLEWNTYRIPLWKYLARVGPKPDSSDIEYARIWMDGTTDSTRVYIAAFNLVQNTWKADTSSIQQLNYGRKFEVAVKNTEENFDYYSPKGVGGFVDVNGVREKEQSLILKYQNFKPGDAGRAQLASSVAQDFTGYRELKMWVHGPLTADTSLARPGADFYFRFGADTRNYYYYSQRVDSGWQSMDIDLDLITQWKQMKLQEFIKDGHRADSLNAFDSTTHVGVRGSPSLSRISYMEIGLVRSGGLESQLDSGEVWFDELRLDNVRRDQGYAGRVSLTTTLADLVGFTANIDTRNYAFRTLNEGRSGSVLNSSGQDNIQVNGTVTLNKFIPDSWGVNLPISMSYSKITGTPKLLVGSDVVLSDSMQKAQQSVTESRTISTNFRWSPPNAPSYWKNTIGALSTTFGTNQSRGRSPSNPENRAESYNASATYSPQFKERGLFAPLMWMRYLLIPRSLYGTKFSVIPTSFSANGNFTRSVQTSVNSNNDTTHTDTRTFNGGARLGMAPIQALILTWDMNTTRNLSEPGSVNLVFSPKEFRLGTEQSFKQRVSADYKPYLFSFLTHSFNASADFSDQIENTPVKVPRSFVPDAPGVPRDYSDSLTVKLPSHNIQLNRRVSVSGTLDVAKVWTFLGRIPPKPAPAKPSRQKLPGAGEGSVMGTGMDDVRSDLKWDPKKMQGPRPPEPAPDKRHKDDRPEGPPRPEEPSIASGRHAADDAVVFGPPVPDTSRKSKSTTTHGGGFGPVTLWRGFLAGLDWITTPIGPLSATYALDEGITAGNLTRRPGVLYQLGLTFPDTLLPPLLPIPPSNGRVPTRTNGEKREVKNNLKFGNILTLSNSYGWSFATRQQSSSATYSMAESYPVLATSFERLERITPIGWIFTTASVRSAYNQRFEESGNGAKRDTTNWTTKTWTKGFAPLINVSGTIHKTIRFGFSFTSTIGKSMMHQTQSQVTETRTRNWDANFDYSFSSPKGIPIPLLRGIRLTSTMTVSMRVSGKNTRTTVNGAPKENSQELSISPQANYSFSTRVKGGFNAQWTDSKANGQRNHIRQLALWAEFTF